MTQFNVGDKVRGRSYVRFTDAGTYEKVYIPGVIVRKGGELLVEYHGPRPDSPESEIGTFYDSLNFIPLEKV